PSVPTPRIQTLSLHDALPISETRRLALLPAPCSGNDHSRCVESASTRTVANRLPNGVAEYSDSAVVVRREGCPPAVGTRHMSACASARMEVYSTAAPSCVNDGWLS